MNPLSKYKKSFILGMQSIMEYRADFIMNLVSAAWPMIIQLFMWSSIYGGSGKEVMFGYTYAQMITYTVIANIVQRLLRTYFEYEINDDIKNGGLDKFIVRPINYFQFRMFMFMGGKLVESVFIYGVLIGAILILNASFGGIATLTSVVWFTAVLVLAAVLNYVIFFCVGMFAFWLSEIGFFFEAVRIVFIACSGGIFPLEVLGSGVVKVMNWLPFKYTVNFPVDVLCGRIPGSEVLGGLLVMGIWAMLLWLLSRVLWRSGLKRYIAAGG